MSYLGTPGRLVEVKCPSVQRVESPSRYAFSTTLGGRTKAQLLPAGDRVWDLAFGDVTTAEQVSVLAAFADGAWGAGPFWFVSTEAPVTNLLTPLAASGDAGATMLYGVQGGVWDTPEGLFARSVLYPGVTPFVGWNVNVPVLPTRRVTGAAIVQGAGGFIRLSWYDAAGNHIANANSAQLSGSGAERLAVTALPPSSAAYVRMSVSPSVVRAARPQVTWTDGPVAWSEGRGCPSAVVMRGERRLVWTDNDGRRPTYESMSFVIQEVS